jgi:hypothetical protein
MRARTDLDFLLYPLATEEGPTCPACGKPMTIALHEARPGRPDFSTFRCPDCSTVRKVSAGELTARRR